MVPTPPHTATPALHVGANYVIHDLYMCTYGCPPSNLHENTTTPIYAKGHQTKKELSNSQSFQCLGLMRFHVHYRTNNLIHVINDPHVYTLMSSICNYSSLATNTIIIIMT